MEEEPTPSTDSPLYIMSREEWGAADARVEDLDDSEFPVVIVNITHHVGAPACNSREECRRVMYDLQRQQIKEGAPDVHFNFIIGGDGTIFEGLGWKYRPWRFWFDDNRRKPSIDIGYLGDFRKQPVSQPIVMSLSSLVKEGQRQNLIHHTFDYVRHLTPVEPFHRNYP